MKEIRNITFNKNTLSESSVSSWKIDKYSPKILDLIKRGRDFSNSSELQKYQNIVNHLIKQNLVKKTRSKLALTPNGLKKLRKYKRDNTKKNNIGNISEHTLPKSGVDKEKWIKMFIRRGGLDNDSGLSADWWEEASNDIEEELGDDFDIKKPEVKTQIDERWSELAFEHLSKEYDRWLALYDSLGDPFEIYRCIDISKFTQGKNIKTIEDLLPGINNKKIGIYWTHEEKSAICHWGRGSSHYNIVLSTKISKNDVNWDDTLWANLDPSIGEDENEITLKEGVRLKITGIRLQRTWYEVDLAART